MSETNRQILYEVHELYRIRRWEEILARYVHEDAEWVDSPELPGAGVHRGHEEILAFHRSWDDAWGSGWDMTLEEIRGDGDVLVSRTTFTGRGKTSGAAPPPFEFASIWTFRDGRIARVETHFDPERALAALSQANRL